MCREDATGGRNTVLVADDNASIRRLVRLTLERSGLAVLEAADGADAASLLGGRAEAIDLLIADVLMPGIDGRDLARLFKAANPGGAVLLVSGAPLQDDLGHPFLAKPFRVNRLREIATQLLGGGSWRADAPRPLSVGKQVNRGAQFGHELREFVVQGVESDLVEQLQGPPPTAPRGFASSARLATSTRGTTAVANSTAAANVSA